MNLKKKFFNKFAYLLFGIFLINSIANFLFWYQSIYWFDDLMHFLGGTAGALFLFWFFYTKYEIWFFSKKYFYIIILNSVVFLLVAFLWEVMEFSVQDLFNIGNVLAEKKDTVRDLFLGILGNFFALIYYFIKMKYYNVRN